MWFVDGGWCGFVAATVVDLADNEVGGTALVHLVVLNV